MFDRIAGVYDLMNSVMTAGLHHRWRERAADLAARRPGRRRSSTSRPARATWRSSSRGASARAARSSARTSPRGCSTVARDKDAAASRWEQANALELPYATTTASTPSPSASARATSPTSTRGCARWRASSRPGGHVVVLEITTPTKPPLSTFFRGLVRPGRPAPRAGRRRQRRLHVPAELGEALPRPARARAAAARRRARRRPLDPDRGRHHRHPRGPSRRRHDGSRRGDAGDGGARRAGGEHVPAADAPRRGRGCAERRGRARRATSPSHAGATIAAGGKRLRPLLVLLAGGAPHRRRPGRGARARRRRRRARPQRDARPRRRPRRRAAAPRPARPSSRRPGRDMADGDRRPAVRARVRRAGRATRDPEAGAACSARRAPRSPAASCCSATDAWDAAITLERYLLRCELKTARLFEAAVRLGPARRRRTASCACAAFGRRIGLAFQLLDDVLDVSGPAERTGKHRGTDLLDGTVTLPLILARERDPELARARRARRSTTPEQAGAALRPHRGDRRARRGARARADARGARPRAT